MKNVKTFFMLRIATMLPSAHRVGSLGGSLGYYAGDGNVWATISPYE